MLVRTLGPEGGGGFGRGSHINCRRERVPARTLGPKGGVDCEIPLRLGKRTKHLLKGYGYILKTVRGNLKGKAQKEQYPLCSSLGSLHIRCRGCSYDSMT